MNDNQISIGTQVVVNEDQHSAPLNGAVGTVVEIKEYDNAPVYTVSVYGATYGGFRAHELKEANG